MKVVRQKNEDKEGEKPALLPFTVNGTRDGGTKKVTKR